MPTTTQLCVCPHRSLTGALFRNHIDLLDHDVATLEMRSSSRETRLRTPIARLWSFRPQYAVGPYVLNASPLASRCEIREEPMSMLIGTRIAKQRDARELFVFD